MELSFSCEPLVALALHFQNMRAGFSTFRRKSRDFFFFFSQMRLFALETEECIKIQKKKNEIGLIFVQQ